MHIVTLDNREFTLVQDALLQIYEECEFDSEQDLEVADLVLTKFNVRNKCDIY